MSKNISNGKGLKPKISEIKADLFLSEAVTGEMALGNGKLKSASATITKDFSESFLSEEQIKI